MKRKLIVVFSGLSLLASFCPPASAKTPTPTAEELIEAAHKTAGLDHVGVYVFTADLTFAGDARRGSLVIYRDKDKEKVELTIGDYSERQVLLGTKHYVEPMHAMLDAWNFAGLDRSWDPRPPTPAVSVSQPSFGKVSSKKVDRERAWCFDEHTKSLKATLCFDAQRTVMLERRRDKDRYDFLDYSQSGEQLLPHTIKIAQQRLPEVTVDNIRLERGPIPTDLWVPSANSIMEEKCEGLKPPKAEYTPEPSFPPKAHQERRTGEVVLYAVVSEQGKIILAQSLNHDSYGFAEQAKEAMKNWRFAPGTCDGKPVNVEMTVEMNFDLF